MAGKLIGVSTQTDGYYEIDPITGAATLVATADRNVSRAGLAWLNGALYASDLRLEPSLTPYQTVRVDLATGASTPVSSQGGSSNWQALAANQAGGFLYAMDTDQGANLWSLTPGGTPTLIGNSIDIRGLAYDDTHGVLYGVHTRFQSNDTVQLYTIDTTTGAATLVGDTGVPAYTYGVLAGLTYDEDAGILYMLNVPDLFGSSPSYLYALDVTTGTPTLIGSTGVNSIDGLTWVPDAGPAAPPPPDPGPATVILGTTLATQISGTAGRDAISDLAGSDYVTGGAGEDTITAGSGSDWIEPGPGADRIILSNGAGIDFIDVVSGGGGPPYGDIIEFSGLTESQLWGYRSGDHYALTELQSGSAGDNFTFLDFYTVADPFDYMMVPLSGGGNRFVTPGTDTNGQPGPDLQQGRLLRFGTSGADNITAVQQGEHSSIYWSGQGDDTLNGGAAPVALFAGSGADTLTSNSPGTGSTLVGGRGADVYNLAVGASAILLDLPSTGGTTDTDLLNAPGLSLSAANFRAWQVDGRHLLMKDTANDTTALIYDWTDPNQFGSRIESYQFGDGTLSHSQLVAVLPSNAGYQGNVTWESLGEGTAAMNQAIVNLRVIAGGDQGSSLNLTIGGTSGDDDLRGAYGSGINTLIGGPGNDLLRGGLGSDHYLFRPGDGQDTVDNVAFASGETNFLRFGGGIRLGRIYGEQDGSDLVLHYGAGDSVRLLDWYGADSRPRVLQIGTSDVNVLNLLSADMVGGSASEIVVGTAGDDVLDGGTGRNRYVGGGGNDTINGHADYEIACYAGPRASYSVSRNGGTLTVTDLDGAANGGDDGVDTLMSIERLQFGDGYLQIRSNPNDLNGDARGDLLWSSGAGSLAQWQQNGTAYVGGGVFAGAASGWTMAALADFNGDGAADILWQHSSGALAEWHMDGITYVGGGVMSGAGTGWTLDAVADFNGDAKADLLWRHSSGAMGMWFLDGTAYVGGGVFSGPGGSWVHAATADFNGDGRADLLWSDGNNLGLWLMDGTGYIGGGVLAGPAGSWTLKAVADFSGDGMADLLWSDGGNGLAQWHMSGTSYIGGGVFSAAGAGWSLASIADFEGDGHADLLWEHSSGVLSLWAMDGTGVIGGGGLGARPSGWDLVTLGQFVSLPAPTPAAQADFGALTAPESWQNAFLA